MKSHKGRSTVLQNMDDVSKGIVRPRLYNIYKFGKSNNEEYTPEYLLPKQPHEPSFPEYLPQEFVTHGLAHGQSKHEESEKEEVMSEDPDVEEHTSEEPDTDEQNCEDVPMQILREEKKRRMDWSVGKVERPSKRKMCEGDCDEEMHSNSICKTTFVPHSNVVYHSKNTHSNKSTLTGEVCGNAFQRKFDHIHCEVKPVDGMLCNKSFHLKQNLVVDELGHGGSNRDSSIHCDKELKKKDLEKHKPKHECDICENCFSVKNNMVVHKGENLLSCTVCRKRFSMKNSLVEHMRLHTGEKPLSCTVCRKCFSMKKSLVQHMRLHTGEKPLSCTVCRKRFSIKKSFVEHMRLHKGEKPLSCTVCRKCFSMKKSLVEHMRLHTGEKPLSCTVCRKCFSMKKSLVEHMRLHTGETPLSCTVCRKRFSMKKSLVEHMCLHKGEKSLSCTVCGKHFSRKGHLVRHMRMHTGA